MQEKDITTCQILGVPIAALDMDGAVAFTVENLQALSGKYYTFVNVYSCVTAHDNPQVLQAMEGAACCMPDGAPLSKYARRKGYLEMARISGPDFMSAIFAVSKEKGYRHFFYGSSQETLDKLRENLENTYPGIQIAGMISPPFRPLTAAEDAAYIEAINAAAPDFVWIGLGAPKQERYMLAHKGRIHGLMLGVGAGFSYHAGTLHRAPKWMQDHSLEWLYRLLQEPGKQFKKYVKTNLKFLWWTRK